MLGHLISFRSDTGPRILFWEKGEVGELELLNKTLSMKFSDFILCTGHRTLDTQLPCPHNMKGWKQCNYCRNKDISKVYTRLDFEGYEELKEEYIQQSFSVYLAAFGNEIIKCGVTRSERVEKRAYEQGADFWVELMRFDDGEEAYDAEIELQNRFGLRNSVRNDMKLKLLGSPKSSGALESKVKEIKAGGFFRDKFCESAIVENKYPVPESFEISYSIDGLITGSKSQLLFYEKEGKSFVVPMNRMAGRVFLLKE